MAAVFGALSGFALSGGLEAYAPSTQELHIQTAELRLEQEWSGGEMAPASTTAARVTQPLSNTSF